MIPVYAGLSIDYRFIALCMNLSLSATGILVGIFAPKIYIAIFRPARNVRSRSGLSVRHVYSNQSFEDEVVGMCFQISLSLSPFFIEQDGCFRYGRVFDLGLRVFPN